MPLYLVLNIYGVTNTNICLYSQGSWLVNIKSVCCRIRNIITKIKHKFLYSKKETNRIYNYVQLLV